MVRKLLTIYHISNCLWYVIHIYKFNDNLLISCACRYYAVLKPLSMYENRGKIMLTIAWICSAICSTPQVSLSKIHWNQRKFGRKSATELNVVKFEDISLLILGSDGKCALTQLEAFRLPQITTNGFDEFTSWITFQGILSILLCVFT